MRPAPVPVPEPVVHHAEPVVADLNGAAAHHHEPVHHAVADIANNNEDQLDIQGGDEEWSSDLSKVEFWGSKPSSKSISRWINTFIWKSRIEWVVRAFARLLDTFWNCFSPMGYVVGMRESFYNKVGSAIATSLRKPPPHVRTCWGLESSLLPSKPRWLTPLQYWEIQICAKIKIIDQTTQPPLSQKAQSPRFETLSFTNEGPFSRNILQSSFANSNRGE